MNKVIPVALSALLVFAGSAFAQPVAGGTGSLDFQGPTVLGPGPFTGIADCFAGIPIDEGAILTPCLPGPPSRRKRVRLCAPCRRRA